MKFRDKMIRFMYGRNGMDALGQALFYVYLILFCINLFVQSGILSMLATVVAVYMLFRMFSKNVNARRAENIKYWNFKTNFSQKCKKVPVLKSIGGFFGKLNIRIQNFGKKSYRTCPSCRAELCLPHRRGKHTAHCPRCGNDFSVRILF